jgi:hypothetical protein
MEKTLDCTGLACPLPVVKTNQAMKDLQSANASGSSRRTMVRQRHPGLGQGAGNTLVSAQEDSESSCSSSKRQADRAGRSSQT